MMDSQFYLVYSIFGEEAKEPENRIWVENILTAIKRNSSDLFRKIGNDFADVFVDTEMRDWGFAWANHFYRIANGIERQNKRRKK